MFRGAGWHRASGWKASFGGAPVDNQREAANLPHKPGDTLQGLKGLA